MAPKIIPVILCGGSGTRLWPMSRRLLPKQFLPLISERSMLQETVLRAATLPQAQPPIIVSSDDHRFFAAQQLAEIGIQPSRIVLEPVARNTAPALAAAALAAGEANDAVLLVLPADHLIRDEAAFAQAVKLGTRAAAAGAMVAFGIVPQSPETGYGYIEQGPALGHEGCFRVARFVEKPDLAKAKTFLAAGNFLWNSGMFMMTPQRYLEELGRYRPDILAGATAAWNQRRDETDFSRLDAASFGACPSDSIDYAVMERTRDAAVVPAEIGWSDVGSWATLWETAELDANGNAVRGDVDLHDTRNSYLRAESRLLSVNGLDNVVVVETNDAVLVTSRDKAQSVKDVVSRLAEGKRSEHLSHRRVYRPWGYYESIDNAAGFQVKRLMVSPGQAISLQLHHRRSEHWVVVSGRARVTRGDDLIYLDANQSTYIPLGMKHRLENPGQVPLYIIEVQSGDYLGEDDIVRFEDRYNRA
ncbi:MAG TPA: mannose-1-phosphate guanylyltransferase/mannose-6-phosphate isomerase [Burkholderiales bacterium]|nr:mannose-1-phosphate guanylyltransferase/mannose-6-phosphate isomerase [Burkholderiales bacterium]